MEFIAAGMSVLRGRPRRDASVISGFSRAPQLRIPQITRIAVARPPINPTGFLRPTSLFAITVSAITVNHAIRRRATGFWVNEIQRNIISERVLKMPRDRTGDTDKPFEDVPRNGTAGRLRLVRIGPVHSDNRLSATLMMGLFATGVATSWTEAGAGGKDAPDTLPCAKVGSGGINC